MIPFARIFSTFLIICVAQIGLIGQCQSVNRIQFLDGTEYIEFCSEDSRKCIAAESLRPPGTSYAFSLTDGEGIILRTTYSNRFCLDEFGPGRFRVYGVAIQGLLLPSIGEQVEGAQLGSFCFQLSANFLEANVVQLNAGEVKAAGTDRNEFCIADGVSEVVQFEPTISSNESYNIFITDQDGIILSILEAGQDYDIDDLGEGNYSVFGVAYSGALLLTIGDPISLSPASDGCYSLTAEAFDIQITSVDGGRVSNDDGEDVVYACPMNGVDDIVIFTTSSNAGHAYNYIVTDAEGIIIGLPMGTGLNFDNSIPGTCLIYGVSYSGEFLPKLGDQVDGLMISDGCFDISENVITVYREDPQAGTIYSTLMQEVAYTCPNDTIEDIVFYQLTDASHSKVAYAITNDRDIVLAVTMDDHFDFTNAPEGICRIYGIAYTGTLTVATGDSVAQVELSDDCFDLTDNYLAVIRAEPQIHVVQLKDSSTFVDLCVGDGAADSLVFENDVTSLAQFRYLITNDDNVVLAITETSEFDFEGAGDGVCRVWGLSYTGQLTVEVGDRLDDGPLASNCFFLSDNFIQVNRYLIDAGTVTGLNDETEVSTCPGDGVADIVTYTNAVSTSATVLYIITSVEDTVLAITSQSEFDFEPAGEGICRVWSVVFTGDLILAEGDVLGESDVSNGCFDISDGFLTVNRFAPAVQTVTSSDGLSSVSICIGDGQDHTVTYMASEASGAAFIYIVTNDQDSILAITENTSIDFDQVGLGICRIYGLSYVGQLIIEPGSHIGDAATEQCYAYSLGYLEIIRDSIESTTVMTSLGETERNLCPGDGMDDVVEFLTSSTSDGPYRYIITDEEDRVLFLPTSDNINFENVNEGICRVYGVSFSGNFILSNTNDLEFFPISDRCYQLSSNFIELRKFPPNWDAFSTSTGDTTIELTVGDGIADVIQFSDDGHTAGNRALLITDESGLVIGISSGLSIDFEGAGEGICIAYGLAYTGELIIDEGENINDGALSSDCYDLSDNVVTVTRTQAVVSLGSDASFAYSMINRELKIGGIAGNEYNLEVYDLLGQLVYTSQMKDAGEVEAVPLGRLRTGTYMVYLRGINQHTVDTYKFIVH